VLRENSDTLILCDITKGKSQGGAPMRGRANRRGGRGSGSPRAMNFAGDAHRHAEIRRAISWLPFDDFKKRQRGSTTERLGYL
jgi:hypothetical protein